MNIIKSTPIVLDSSIFKQTPKLNSPLFDLLIRYTRLNIFGLYIPEVVENEYKTWISIEAKSAFASVIKATESLDKFSEANALINLTAYASKNQVDEVIVNSFLNWKEFKTRANATDLPILGGHGQDVMKAYFSGSTPFKQIKHRQDIPDAFIYFAIKDLLKSSDEIVFVTQDKQFASKMQTKQIKIFSGLAEVFSSVKYKLSDEYFENLSSEHRCYKAIMFHLDDINKKVSRSIELSDLATSIERELAHKVIGVSDEVVVDAQNISLDIDAVKLITDTACLVPFSAILLCEKRSCANLDDINAANPERVKNLLSKDFDENGDYNLSELETISVSGNAIIEFDKSSPLRWQRKNEGIEAFTSPGVSDISTSIESIQLSQIA